MFSSYRLICIILRWYDIIPQSLLIVVDPRSFFLIKQLLTKRKLNINKGTQESVLSCYGLVVSFSSKIAAESF